MDGPSKDRLVAFAFNLDMNSDEFSDCLDTSKYNKRVKANYDEAVKTWSAANTNVHYSYT